MNSQEQIEEMALFICGRDACKNCIHFIDATICGAVSSAKKLYAAGYRKHIGMWKYRYTLFGFYFYSCTGCGYIQGVKKGEDIAKAFPYCLCGRMMEGIVEEHK